jgi:Thioredoxin like C-terminal domain
VGATPRARAADGDDLPGSAIPSAPTRCCRHGRRASSSLASPTPSGASTRTLSAAYRRAPLTLTEQRLYQLIRQPGPIADRLFEIEFLDSGVEACAFTFG